MAPPSNTHKIKMLNIIDLLKPVFIEDRNKARDRTRGSSQQSSPLLSPEKQKGRNARRASSQPSV